MVEPIGRDRFPERLAALNEKEAARGRIIEEHSADLAESVGMGDSYSLTIDSPELSHDAPKKGTSEMSEITREELNARLEALESRMDGRVSAIGGKIDSFLAAQAERDKAGEYRFGRVELDISSMKSDLKTAASDVHGIRTHIAKYTGGIAVAAAIAGIVIGAVIRFIPAS